MPKPPLDKTHPRLATLLHITVIAVFFIIGGFLVALRSGGGLGFVYLSALIGVSYGVYSASK